MVEIREELKNNFFTYASCVNNERSFPDARDGLKPGMRATLWEMYTKGYSSNKPHVKCAKVSGGTIATWWPHGDVGIYEAMVRLSQEWVNNLTAIDFHGSNGSLLGGPYAANQRYTECRLARSTEDGYFTNIKKNVVDFIDNFSEDDKWPSVFPSIAPMLMINGSSGIGYTIAQDWLPHNLRELAVIVEEYMTTGKLNTTELWPDFPTGGSIINKAEIKNIYETGKGRVILRGKSEIIGQSILITELPYQIYAEAFIQKVKDLIHNETITGIEDIYNKSGDEGLLIEIVCETEPEAILAKLHKLTDLQVTLSANQMALVNGIPKMLTLREYLDVYMAHNIDVIKREYSYELHKASQRLEVVDGLIRACSILDDVIREIRASESTSKAVEALITKFSFTKTQAQAITDMRLGKLANMEIQALQKEADQLNKTIAGCNKMLTSEKARQKEFLKRLRAFVDTYSWDRKTTVCNIDLEAEKTGLLRRVKVAETCIVAIDGAGFLKRVSAAQYKSNKKLELKTVEIADDQKLIIITNHGIMYKLPVKQIPRAGINSTGTDIKTLISLKADERAIAIYSGTEETPYIFFITKCGLAKKTLWADIVGLSKNIGTTVMKLNENDEIIICDLIDSKQYKVIYNGREKQIFSDKFIAKSRTAGGVCAVKTKAGNFIALPLL